MNNKAQFTPLKKAVHAIPMLYAEAFAGSNNKEFVVELYKDARLLETAAPAMYEALSELVKYLREEVADEALNTWAPVFKAAMALAQAEGRQG